MESSQPRGQHRYNTRAQKLKTKMAAQKEQQRQAAFEAESQGLTRQQYWKTRVHSKEDVVKYYGLYYPDYPEILVNSIAAKLEEVLHKSNNGTPLSDEEKRLFQSQQDLASTWDPTEDIQREMLEGKIQLTSRRLEKLLEEEEEEKKKQY